MKKVGAMLDCSRNAVYTESALKKYIKLLSEMGYNSLQLYTEDTFELEDEPYFGYMRGKYTVGFLREIDRYALSCGIELVPCIQTLAHLSGVAKWKHYEEIVDTADILLVGEEKTYELIDKMFSACAKAFTSRRINIGMDEAHMVGLGKYLDRHGYENRFDILLKHLNRVCGIAKKYGFKPMMWSDMFFRLANCGEYYLEDTIDIPLSVIEKVPPEIKLIYWDYYSEKPEVYDAMIKSHKNFHNSIVFAGGAWSWSGFVPHNAWSNKVSGLALKACAENDIEEVFVTSWRDDGGECSLFGNLPALYCFAEYAHGNFDLTTIKNGFYNLTGVKFDDFMTLDMPDTLYEKCTRNNASKYMLYSDPFFGWLDYTVDENKTAQFYDIAEKLDKLTGNAEFGYVFDTISKLCGVLAIKFDLGVCTRNAYKSGNTDEIKRLVNDYEELERRLEKFYECFLAQRNRECLMYGFEFHDIRLGGLIRRVKHCKDMLAQYAEGKLNKIDALEENILPAFTELKEKCDADFNGWLDTAVIRHTKC